MVDVVCRQRPVTSDLQMRLLGLDWGLDWTCSFSVKEKRSRKGKARHGRAQSEARQKPNIAERIAGHDRAKSTA